MIKPDPNDPFKVRRFLALISLVYALLVYPNLMVFYVLALNYPADHVSELLMYVGTVSSGPIGLYLWAANRGDKND